MNTPNFTYDLSDKVEFHLVTNNGTEMFQKKNKTHDQCGSHGYIYYLQNVSNINEEVKYVVKVTKSDQNSRLEGAIGFLIKKLNFQFFPKFIKINNITKAERERFPGRNGFNFCAMSYCGISLVEAIKKKRKTRCGFNN